VSSSSAAYKDTCLQRLLIVFHLRSCAVLAKLLVRWHTEKEETSRHGGRESPVFRRNASCFNTTPPFCIPICWHQRAMHPPVLHHRPHTFSLHPHTHQQAGGGKIGGAQRPKEGASRGTAVSKTRSKCPDALDQTPRTTPTLTHAQAPCKAASFWPPSRGLRGGQGITVVGCFHRASSRYAWSFVPPPSSSTTPFIHLVLLISYTNTSRRHAATHRPRAW
jgi:hypothetical protein